MNFILFIIIIYFLLGLFRTTVFFFAPITHQPISVMNKEWGAIIIGIIFWLPIIIIQFFKIGFKRTSLGELRAIKSVFIWNPHHYTDQENLQWCWIRAIEWGIWPAFITIPVVPVLFLFFTWWKVICAIIILTILWAFVRYRFVNLTLATLGVYFVFLKWITCPVVALLLVLKHEYVLAILALIWPLLAANIGIFVGGSQIGIIQKMFMAELGYESKNTSQVQK